MCLTGATRASAQDEEPAAVQGRFHVGPLRFTPSILLTNIGVDNNVFNDTSNPQQDTTAAIGPAADLWMNAGRSRVTGKVAGQYLYYNKFDNQRAFNTSDEGKWEVPLARITPFIAGSYANTKDRPGFEIDSRARQTATTVSAGSELRLSAKTGLVVTGRRSTTAFDANDTFLGADLATELNHTTTSEELQFRYKMTSLTTFVANASGIQDRFGLNTIRNANSIQVLPGFELKPAALISGTVFVGVRRFEPLDPSVPANTGVVAQVAAKLNNGSRQFDVKVGRDLTYSISDTDPYYTLTDLNLSITQRVTYAWDVVVRGAWQTLDYQALQTVTPLDGRTDRIRQYGGGIGYRLGRTMRIGFDANYYRCRSSDVAQRDYEGLRFGGSVSYGLPQ